MIFRFFTFHVSTEKNQVFDEMKGMVCQILARMGALQGMHRQKNLVFR
jgi:hypothetical protein